MNHDELIEGWARGQRERALPPPLAERIEAAVVVRHPSTGPRRRGLSFALFAVGAVRLAWLLVSAIQWR